MSIFTPKISQIELQRVKTLLKQVQESAKLVNNTIKPDVYFGRLNFLFDLFLTLQEFEKYKIFTGKSPTQDYNYLLRNMEQSVNNFIDRSFENQYNKMKKLKTDKSKTNSYLKYDKTINNAFLNANTFWSGNTGSKHYTGKLYTENNIKYLNEKLNLLNTKG